MEDILTPDDYLEQVLPGFTGAEELLAGAKNARCMGYKGSRGDFFRFVHRFRLAQSFQGVMLEGYQDNTAEAYGAMNKLFLMWSTFEMYCHLCGQQFHKMFGGYPKRKTHELAGRYRELDNDGLLLDFLIEQTVIHGKDEFLRKFRDGNNLYVITIAATMRHIFAHGHLTVHVRGMETEAMQRICDQFTAFIESFIKHDFAQKVALARANSGLNGAG